jgi:hypothetical protein
MKIDPSETKQKLFEEANYVYEQMSEFNEATNKKQYPETVYIINYDWFALWKKRVNYAKLESEMKALKQLKIFKSVNLQSTGSTMSNFGGNQNPPPNNFFGNWK